MLSRYRERVRTWTDPVGLVLFRLHLRPNHLTVIGLGVSMVAAAAFMTGRVRWAGLLLALAGLFDFFDGSLARVSGQVTPFGAFLDSVIDRYSDLVVLLSIVVFYAGMSHVREAMVAMAGLMGSVMVSYTKARAASIGVDCSIGFMERPERMICLIAGSLFDLLEPALWVLAVLANVTALHRILFTRRAARSVAILPLAVLVVVLGPVPARAGVAPETEQAWAAAVEALQHGDPRPAATAMGTETARNGPIADYTQLLLADALARRGDVAGARAAVAALVDRRPDSRVAPSALIIGSTLAARAGDESGARAALKRLIDSYPDAPQVPEALYLLGVSSEALGETDVAAHAYRQLTLLAPASPWASGASDRLAALQARGVATPELSIPQRVDRAERLLRGGAPGTAADEAERIVQETPEPGLLVRALRVVADASQRLGRYDFAARLIELTVSRVPADRRPALRLEQARLLVRAGKKEQALAVLTTLGSARSSPESAEASYVRAQILDDLDRAAEAVAAYRAVVREHPHREVAGAALWRLGWIAYLRSDLRGADQAWTRLASLPGGRAYRLGALYWSGRAREQTAGPAPAQQLYRRILAEGPRSYYGVLAARRVAGAAAPTAEPTVRLPADPEEALAGDPGFARVELLRRIGLVEFAWLELEDVVQRAGGDPVRLFGLSGAYAREARYHLALRILRRTFGGPASAGDPGLPQALWEMLYPFGWRSQVTEAAEEHGLDPFLVAAVVREESSYYPRAVSRTGARGLMQLMPGTAQPLAERRGLVFQDGELLEDPGANIQIGTSFLADLLRQFGDPRLALAAYNAGPRRAREWWQARRTNDVEAFVEQIPFDETRRYVKRVMLSWDEYRRIYGGSR